jgi:hypothetical protein
MAEPTFFSLEHIELFGIIVMPLGSGIMYLIWQQAQMTLKVNTMWRWFSNDAHELTGYQPGDEKRKKAK